MTSIRSIVSLSITHFKYDLTRVLFPTLSITLFEHKSLLTKLTLNKTHYQHKRDKMCQSTNNLYEDLENAQHLLSDIRADSSVLYFLLTYVLSLYIVRHIFWSDLSITHCSIKTAIAMLILDLFLIYYINFIFFPEKMKKTII